MQLCSQVKRRRGSVVVWLAALIVAGGADQRKMRLTGLDHWTLNLFPPVGRDVISHCGIRQNTHMHTKGGIEFSLLFSRVTAWVNRLFEVSENWISEAALLFFPLLALKLNHRQVKMHFEPTCFTTQGCVFYYLCRLNKSERGIQWNLSDVPAKYKHEHMQIHLKTQTCLFTFNCLWVIYVLSLFSFTDNCNGPLVSTLPQSSFQSSSQSSVSYAAYNAKLNRRDGEYKSGCSCTGSVFLHASDMHHPPAAPAVTS